MTRSATLIPMAAAVQTDAIASAAVPVTAEEAEALARRIRVESKIPRLALVGTILGVVFGFAAIWPFTDSGGYMAEALLSGTGIVAFAPGWLLAGLLPLVAFYAGRLHFQSKNAATAELESSLRKIRRLLFWSMIAAAIAFIGVATSRSGYRRSVQSFDVAWMPLLYVACFAACATLVGDVRRGLGDFDSEHQRRRRRLVRGFQVELVPAASPAPVPVATLAALPLGDDNDAGNNGDDIPLATAVASSSFSSSQPALPPPLPQPLPQPLPRAISVPFERAAEDEHSKDLRLILTLAIMAGICVHAVRIGEIVARFGATVSFFEQLANAVGGTGGSQLSLIVTMEVLAAFLLVPCGLLWIFWGVSALNYGPGARSAAIILAVATLILAAVVVLPWWVFDVPAGEFSRSSRFDYSSMAGRLSRAPEIVHAALMLLLLTRPGIRNLFAKNSVTGDEN